LTKKKAHPSCVLDHSSFAPPVDPSADATFQACDKDTLFRLLNDMCVMRRFEEKAASIYTMGKIGGFCHLCIGQEGTIAGIVHAMQPQDTLITAYRSHGYALMMGLSPFQVMAELMGKEGGCSQGKGGSMHMFNKDTNFYGGHGIVGAQTSLGTGLAFAHKYKKDNGVCLTLMGDGASNQGQFFESMNMASLWQLPVLYIIENNGYSMGTSVARGCAGKGLFRRGEPFDIPGYQILGDDMVAVHAVISSLLHTVRTTQKPILLEIDTYRFKGHSMSDPGKYRTRDELDKARQSRDPIAHLFAYCVDNHGMTQDEFDAIDAHAKATANTAFDQADAAPEPSLSHIEKDIIV
jgi:pyruvate dehydrogenase E1 component alpha subunit